MFIPEEPRHKSAIASMLHDYILPHFQVTHVRKLNFFPPQQKNYINRDFKENEPCVPHNLSDLLTRENAVS